MAMLLSTIRLRPLPGQRLELLEILRSVEGPTLAQEGCLACRIYQEEGDRSSILFCEEWDNETSLHRHIGSNLYQRVLAAMDLSSDRPHVCFHRVSATEGMELIERLRRSAEASECLNSQPELPVS